jgi:hypothetical protein
MLASAMPDASYLESLVGGHLDTVSFVMGYVEFRIDYSILRALTNPIVQGVDGQISRFPEPGSRDALCRLIDSTVVAASEKGDREADNLRIEIETDGRQTLVIPLDSRSLRGVEGAHLVPADERGHLDVAKMAIW